MHYQQETPNIHYHSVKLDVVLVLDCRMHLLHGQILRVIVLLVIVEMETGRRHVEQIVRVKLYRNVWVLVLLDRVLIRTVNKLILENVNARNILQHVKFVHNIQAT